MSETVTIEAPTTPKTLETGLETNLAVGQREDQEEGHVATEDTEKEEPIVQASDGVDVTSQAPAEVVGDIPVVDQAAAQAAGLDSADSGENLKRAARAFLDVHRDEVAQREEEISKLRAELKRVREGLKALETAAERCETRRDANRDEEWQLTADDPDVTSVAFFSFLLRSDQNLTLSSFQKIKERWETCFIAVQDVMEAQDTEEVRRHGPDIPQEACLILASSSYRTGTWSIGQISKRRCPV